MPSACFAAVVGGRGGRWEVYQDCHNKTRPSTASASRRTAPLRQKAELILPPTDAGYERVIPLIY